MPIAVEWGDHNKTFIQYTFTGEWTWEELFIAEDQIKLMVTEVSHTVNSLIDMRSSSLLPDNALSITRSIDRHPDSRRGMTILVGGNRLMVGLADILRRLGSSMAQRTQFANSIDEAVDILKQLSFSAV